MRSHGSRVPRRVTRRVVPRLALALVVLLLLALVWPWAPRRRSVAYQRDGWGELRVVAGEAPIDIVLRLARTRSETHGKRSRSSGLGRQPLRLSSVTIVDLSGTRLSSRVAHALLAQWRERSDVEWADARIAGDPLEGVTRIGDQLLTVEQVGPQERVPPVAGRARAALRLTLGRVPRVAWNEYVESSQGAHAEWDVEAEVSYVAVPGAAGLDLLAEALAEQIDLPRFLDELAALSPPAPPVPRCALPAEGDLAGAAAVPRAAGIPAEPLLSGVRIGGRGEALWRCEEHDAIERVQRCLDALMAAGWEQVPGFGSTGTDGLLHHFVARLGDATAEVQIEKNRHDLDGLTPTIWLHYWKHPSLPELEATLARAEAEGPATREAFLANLSPTLRALLDPQAAASAEPSTPVAAGR